ncbi:MAG TPA: surface-adhesin E family protein [Bryobacteraceae bacterium]|nr:surface-adhesin E family protein [Bryobacteraceae bacterium]
MSVFRMIIAAGVLAISLFAAEWKQAGVTSQGNRVYIRDVKGRGENRSAWIRIEYKDPMKTANGIVKSSRARVRVNCTNRTAAADETIMYIDEAMNQIASQRKLSNEPFTKEPAGSFGDVAVQAICASR